MMHNTTYNKIVVKKETLGNILYGKVRHYNSDKYSAIIKSSWRVSVSEDETFFDQKNHFSATTADAPSIVSSPQTLKSTDGLDDENCRNFRGGFETSDPNDL